jgi:hypothetical protein
VWWFVREVPPPTETGVVDAACDLHTGPCSAVFGPGAKLAFTLGPSPITPEQPLALRVRTEGVVPQRMWADFSGAQMNMGVHRARMVRQPDGAWHGTAELPTCPSGRMLWQVQLSAETEGVRRVAGWRFEASAP